MQGFSRALADSGLGVSGGTVAFVLGFYDKLINFLNKLISRKWDKKEAIKFLLSNNRTNDRIDLCNNNGNNKEFFDDKILIVENEKQMADFITLELKHEGFVIIFKEYMEIK